MSKSKREAFIEINAQVAHNTLKLAEFTAELHRMALAGVDISEGIKKLAVFAELLQGLTVRRDWLARETNPDAH